MEDTVKLSAQEKDACARGRNFTDVSELPSEHGVHRRKSVDRLVYVIRTSFKRWNFWKALNLKNTHMVWIVWSIRKDRSIWNAALETKEYLSELKWKFEGSTFYSLQIWQVCSIICWSSDSFQRREFQVECSPSLYRPLIKRKPFLIVTWGFLNAFNFAYLLYDEISNLMKSRCICIWYTCVVAQSKFPTLDQSPTCGRSRSEKGLCSSSLLNC